MGNNLATEMAPPFVLVAHYFIAGVLFYISVSAALPFFSGELESFFISSKIASLMHLHLLGFVMMIIFGAMYQLIPVVLEIPIFSKDFAYIQFYMFVVGIVMFSLALYFDSLVQMMPYGAFLLYLSMLIFVINVFLTYRNIERWSIAAKYIIVSNVFLLIAVTIGFFMALNMIYGFFAGDMLPLIKAHVMGTIGGYVIMTTLGVGIILLPMFSLSHGFSEKPVERAFYLLSAGVGLYLVNVILGFGFLDILSLSLCAVAIIFGIYQMWLIFTTRIRKQNDYWAKNMIASFVFLIASIAVLALSLIFGNDGLILLFGFLVFFGFFVFFIIGHIYKILPFLVWYQRYSPLVGKQKVPMLHDMIVEKVADYQFWITLTGTLMSALGIALSIASIFIIGSLIITAGVILVVYNVRYTLVYGLEDLKDEK